MGCPDAYELHAAYPDNIGFKNGLAISCSKLGETHSSLGNLAKALEFFEIQTKLFEELHRAYPDNVGFKNGLAISYVKLGEVAEEPSQKRTHYQKAEQLWVELTEAFPDYAEFQRFLGLIRERLADL
jgi:tetratricopeptide (TPR) repeat protein